MGLNKEGAQPNKCTDHVGKKPLNLYHFKQNGMFCDVDLVSGETEVKAHRVVLAASCKYFETIFDDSQKDHVALPSVPSNILPILVDYIYTGETVIESSTAKQLLVAAHELGLQELVTACEEFLTKQLQPSNALQYLRFAELYNCKMLAEEALEHAQANWNTAANGDGLVELPLPNLVTLLSSNLLKVDSEAQVLRSALRWLEHNPVDRRQHCPEVLSHIRFPLIAPKTLDKAVKDLQDSHIALALETLIMAMKLGRVAAEPRPSTGRVLMLVGDQIAGKQPSLKFHFDNREWEECAPTITRRCRPSVATLGGRVYAVGGTFKRDITCGEVYDLQTDEWSNIAPIKPRRYDYGLTECNGRLYVFGGSELFTTFASVLVYDSNTDEWTHAADMPQPRTKMGVITYEGRIYLIGGETKSDDDDSLGDTKRTRDLLSYNPESSEWRTLAPMRSERWDFATAVMDGYLYLIGGQGLPISGLKKNVLTSVERYNFDNDSWEEVCSLNEARVRCVAGAAGGVLVVAGGAQVKEEGFLFATLVPLASVEEYDPRENTWRVTTALPAPRYDAGAALL